MTTHEKSITVTRTIDAPAKDIFDVLSLPARHKDFDGSGFVRSSEDTERITKAGEQFAMNMEGEHMGGEYTTYNHVSAFDENKMIGWKPTPEQGAEDTPGWEWLYELSPLDSGDTEVSLTYDWSKVGDDFLKKVSFPLVSEEQMEESLNLLAAAVTKS